MPTVDQYKRALINAHNKGDKQAAQLFADKIKEMSAQSQQPPQPELPKGTPLGGAGEVIKAIGGGVIGAIEGGIKGIESLEDGSLSESADIVRQTQQDYAAPPKTQTGQRYLKNTGDFMELVDKITATGIGAVPTALASLIEGTDLESDLKSLYEGGTEGIADRVFKETGNSAAAGTAGVLLPSVLGMMGGKPPVSPDAKLLKTNILKSAINAGEADPKIAKMMVNNAGKVIKDPLAKETIRQGFDSGVVSAIKAGTETDRQVMREMLNTIKKMKKDAVYAQDARPSDAAGKQLIKRVGEVEKIRRLAGKEVDAAARGLKGQQVETAPVIKGLQDDLSRIGVNLDDSGNLAFKGSDLEGDLPAQRVISTVIDRMRNTQAPDAYDFHRMKKFIDNRVDYGKKNQKAMTNTAENIIKKLRANIDGQLDDLSPSYDKANTKFSDAITALDQIGGAAGKKLDFSSPSGSNQSGILLRRLTSNIQSRGQLKDAINATEGIASKYGSRFEDNMSLQMLLAQELERMFKFSPSTSLGGEVKKNITAATQGRQGIVAAGIDKVGDAVEKARGINEDAAIKSLEKLLERK